MSSKPEKSSEKRGGIFRRSKSADEEGLSHIKPRYSKCNDGMLTPEDVLQMAAQSVEQERKLAKKERRHTSIGHHAAASVRGKERHSTTSMHAMDPQAIISMLESYAGEDSKMASNCLESLKSSAGRSKPLRTSSCDSPYKKAPASNEGKRVSKAKRASAAKETKRPSLETDTDWANVSISDLLVS